MYGLRSVSAYVDEEASFASNAYCCTAPSYWRRLLMQAFACDVVRALTKLGIAIAAKSPIMATTIMISTRVKPALFDALLFILILSRRRERGHRRVIACRNRPRERSSCGANAFESAAKSRD